MAIDYSETDEIHLDADQIETLVTPRQRGVLFGHDKACRFLEKAVQDRSLHHALLISGPKGIGKATLAYQLARASLQPDKVAEMTDPQGHFLHARWPVDGGEAGQISALAHPNLLAMQKQWNFKSKQFASSIDVEQVRRLGQFSSRSAARDGERVVIIDQVEHLNNNAANALLKSLEEPPAGLRFLLVASDLGSLPPTILSRCYQLRLNKLDVSQMKQVVHSVLEASDYNKVPTADIEIACQEARGSARRALTMLIAGGVALQQELNGIFKSLPKVEHDKIALLVEKVTAKGAETRFELLCDMQQNWVNDTLRLSLEGGSNSDPDKLARLWTHLIDQKMLMQRLNLDRRAFLLDSFEQIAQVMR